MTDITAGRISEYRAKRLAVTRGEGAPFSPAAVNRPLALLRHLLRLASCTKTLTSLAQLRDGDLSDADRW